MDMKEFCLLSEDKAQQGYVLNEAAINEMEHIAEAAHMKENFRIVQPSFFSAPKHDHNLTDNILSTPKTLATSINSVENVFPSFGLHSSYSTSHISSGVGSFRSVDSNISDNSHRGSVMGR